MSVKSIIGVAIVLVGILLERFIPTLSEYLVQPFCFAIGMAAILWDISVFKPSEGSLVLPSQKKVFKKFLFGTVFVFLAIGLPYILFDRSEETLGLFGAFFLFISLPLGIYGMVLMWPYLMCLHDRHENRRHF